MNTTKYQSGILASTKCWSIWWGLFLRARVPWTYLSMHDLTCTRYFPQPALIWLCILRILEPMGDIYLVTMLKLPLDGMACARSPLLSPCLNLHEAPRHGGVVRAQRVAWILLCLMYRLSLHFNRRGIVPPWWRIPHRDTNTCHRASFDFCKNICLHVYVKFFLFSYKL